MRSLPVVVQGQRVVFPLQPSGILAHPALDLIRAEDDNVATWQVTLSPIFRAGVGQTIFGTPSRVTPNTATGGVVVVMTWGGGGVKFTTQFPYPVNGASFSVAGDNIQVQVVATDNATVFSALNTPAVCGWAAKRSSPVAPEPLIIFAGTAPATVIPLDPWCRAIHVGCNDPAALITVQFNTALSGALVYAFPAGTRIERIPVLNDTVSVQWTTTAGLVVVTSEVAFT